MAAAGKPDFYEALGLDRSATTEEIKSAFRKLAMQFHPDRNPAADATARFKQIGEAYEVLSDPEKRARYDRLGAGWDGRGGTGFEGFEFGGFGDIFDAFFGGRRAPRGPTRGQDLRVQLDLEFAEAVFGAEKEIRLSRLEQCAVCRGSGAEPGTERARCPQCAGRGEVQRSQRSVFGQFVNVSICDRCEGEGSVLAHPCRHCGGGGREQRNRRLRVKIPAGIDAGSQMRLSNEGDAGRGGGPSGSVYVQLQVKRHALFRREGDDLQLTLPLNVAQAALGTELAVQTLEGEEEVLRVPSGTQHGAVFRIRRRGVPHLHGRGRGDLLVGVALAVPAKLTAEQRALFEQLQAALPDPSGDEAGGIFSRLKDAFTT